MRIKSIFLIIVSAWLMSSPVLAHGHHHHDKDSQHEDSYTDILTSWLSTVGTFANGWGVYHSWHHISKKSFAMGTIKGVLTIQDTLTHILNLAGHNDITGYLADKVGKKNLIKAYETPLTIGMNGISILHHLTNLILPRKGYAKCLAGHDIYEVFMHGNDIYALLFKAQSEKKKEHEHEHEDHHDHEHEHDEV